MVRSPPTSLCPYPNMFMTYPLQLYDLSGQIPTVFQSKASEKQDKFRYLAANYAVFIKMSPQKRP